jgi:hypothetical protein
MRVHPLRAASALIAAGAVLSGPVAMMIVSRSAPQPAWESAEAFARHYAPIQALPYVLGFLLLAGFVWFIAGCFAIAAVTLRVRATAAVVFTAIYAAMVFTNYTLQVGYVPRVLGESPAVAAAITMANPSSLGWFLEMFGYAAVGVATWLVAPAFGGSARGVTIRWLLIANGVVSVIGALCTALFDRWVFSTAGFVSFAGWNLLVIACFGLLALSPIEAALASSCSHSESAIW